MGEDEEAMEAAEAAEQMDVVEANGDGDGDGEDEEGEEMDVEEAGEVEGGGAKKLSRALRNLEEYGAGAGDKYYGTNGGAKARCNACRGARRVCSSCTHVP